MHSCLTGEASPGWLWRADCHRDDGPAGLLGRGHLHGEAQGAQRSPGMSSLHWYSDEMSFQWSPRPGCCLFVWFFSRKIITLKQRLLQSWAHATNVATICHYCIATKLMHLSHNCLLRCQNAVLIREVNIFCVVAYHGRINTYVVASARCRLSQC